MFSFKIQNFKINNVIFFLKNKKIWKKNINIELNLEKKWCVYTGFIRKLQIGFRWESVRNWARKLIWVEKI